MRLCEIFYQSVHHLQVSGLIWWRTKYITSGDNGSRSKFNVSLRVENWQIFQPEGRIIFASPAYVSDPFCRARFRKETALKSRIRNPSGCEGVSVKMLRKYRINSIFKENRIINPVKIRSPIRGEKIESDMCLRSSLRERAIRSRCSLWGVWCSYKSSVYRVSEL